MTESAKALGHLKTARAGASRAAAGPRKHTVTLVAGDGVGEEVAEAVVKLIEAMGVSLGWDRQAAGQKALSRDATPVPPALVRSIMEHKIALKGRLTAPAGGPGEPPSVALRRALGIYASVRPARSLAGLKSRYDRLDLVVIRESTEDLYAGIEHEVVPGVVESLKVVTQAACDRIAAFAFDYAGRHGRRCVTAVHKANIMKLTDGLFLECCRQAASQHPGIEYREMIADNCMMQLVLDPRQFDVLVMENMLGDIVSDLCAGLVGGLGTVPAINIGPNVAMFEAIHGNAPHLEGQDLATPLPMITAAAAMLEHLGEAGAAGRLMAATSRVLSEGRALTPDLGGTSHTSEMTQAIIGALEG